MNVASEFRSAWRKITVRSRTPFARAVVVYGACSDTSSEERRYRACRPMNETASATEGSMSCSNALHAVTRVITHVNCPKNPKIPHSPGQPWTRVVHQRTIASTKAGIPHATYESVRRSRSSIVPARVAARMPTARAKTITSTAVKPSSAPVWPNARHV